MRYQHVVFDVDGTLVDTEYTVLQSLSDTIYQLRGERKERKDLTFALGITGVDVLKRLGFTDIDGALKLWLENLVPYYQYNKLFPGALETLKTLKEMGCTTGVATSRMRSLFDVEVPGLGITKYLDYVVCADDSATHKPQAGPLETYMAWAKAEKKDVLYVGDSVYDALCAQNAGVDFALAGWGATEELKQAHPDCPKTITEVPELVRG